MVDTHSQAFPDLFTLFTASLAPRTPRRSRGVWADTITSPRPSARLPRPRGGSQGWKRREGAIPRLKGDWNRRRCVYDGNYMLFGCLSSPRLIFMMRDLFYFFSFFLALSFVGVGWWDWVVLCGFIYLICYCFFVLLVSLHHLFFFCCCCWQVIFFFTYL